MDEAADPAGGHEPADVTLGHIVAGVVGLGMLRHWYVDGSTNAQRVAELREVLDRLDEHPWSIAVNPVARDLSTGYDEWSASYDGPNPMIATEEEVVRPILAARAGAGVRALDAACGTGRHAAFLAELGCATTGNDRSEGMLRIAADKVPTARFDLADVRALPYRDSSFDLAVVSLALCHLPDPEPAVVELARVLRPGGTLVVTDPHTSGVFVGGQAFYGRTATGLAWVRNHYHQASTWLRSFRSACLVVEDCIEPPYSLDHIATNPAVRSYPDAALAAIDGVPSLWVWVLTKPA